MAKLNAKDNTGGRVNKTSICSVLFIDIIDCSLKPVSEQIENKDCFNALLTSAIKNIAESDRIILDTGDGAAVALMGAPEDALFAALVIRDGIIRHNRENNQHIYVRIGINLGSVIVVNDINGRLNILGDGVNVAQRIMSFASSNQIMVSRSYYEVTSRLTKEITGMFTYSGIKHDKHVREHEVYVIRSTHEETSLAALVQKNDVVSDIQESTSVNTTRKHWPVLILTSFGIIVLVTLFFATLAPSDPSLLANAIPPTEIDQIAATVSPTQAATVPLEPSFQEINLASPALIEPISSQPEKPVKSINKTINQSAKLTSSSKNENEGQDPAPAIEPSEKNALLSQEVTRRDSSNPQYVDTVSEQKAPKESGWKSFTKSFKQGTQKKTCTQAEKLFNQCQE